MEFFAVLLRVHSHANLGMELFIIRMRSYDCRGQHFKNIHSLAPATAALAAVQEELIEWIPKHLKLDYQSIYSVVMVSRPVSCLNSLALGSCSRLA